MCVVDISSAYRSVPIFPPHSDYQGMRWDFDDGQGTVFLRENHLCFGLKCAPFIFSLLSDLVVDMVKAKGVEPSKDKCAESQAILISVLRHLGFSISW